MFFRKSTKYEMNLDTANNILQNVLASESKIPNTIPFDKLVLREKANTRFYDRIQVILVVAMVLTFLSPLVVIPMAGRIHTHYVIEVPTLVDDYVANGILYLQLDGREIRFEDAWLETTDGRRFPINAYDKETGIIAFPYIEDAESNIYVPTDGGSVLHLLLTPL